MQQILINLLKSNNNAFLYIFFCGSFFIGWVANGLFNANFDIVMLMGFYSCLAGKDVIGHAINSIYNSTRGTMPTSYNDKKGEINK